MGLDVKVPVKAVLPTFLIGDALNASRECQVVVIRSSVTLCTHCGNIRYSSDTQAIPLDSVVEKVPCLHERNVHCRSSSERCTVYEAEAHVDQCRAKVYSTSHMLTEPMDVSQLSRSSTWGIHTAYGILPTDSYPLAWREDCSWARSARCRWPS